MTGRRATVLLLHFRTVTKEKTSGDVVMYYTKQGDRTVKLG